MMPQSALKRPIVHTEQAVEKSLGSSVNAAMFGVRGRFDETAAQHRREGQRNKARDQHATIIVTANSCSRRPRMPLMKSTGRNTAASDNVIEIMVNPISRDPFSAAANGVSPASIWRTMFSSMTIASSTRSRRRA